MAPTPTSAPAAWSTPLMCSLTPAIATAEFERFRLMVGSFPRGGPAGSPAASLVPLPALADLGGGLADGVHDPAAVVALLVSVAPLVALGRAVIAAAERPTRLVLGPV